MCNCWRWVRKLLKCAPLVLYFNMHVVWAPWVCTCTLNWLHFSIMWTESHIHFLGNIRHRIACLAVRHSAVNALIYACFLHTLTTSHFYIERWGWAEATLVSCSFTLFLVLVSSIILHSGMWSHPFFPGHPSLSKSDLSHSSLNPLMGQCIYVLGMLSYIQSVGCCTN